MTDRRTPPLPPDADVDGATDKNLALASDFIRGPLSDDGVPNGAASILLPAADALTATNIRIGLTATGAARTSTSATFTRPQRRVEPLPVATRAPGAWRGTTCAPPPGGFRRRRLTVIAPGSRRVG